MVTQSPSRSVVPWRHLLLQAHRLVAAITQANAIQTREREVSTKPLVIASTSAGTPNSPRRVICARLISYACAIATIDETNRACLARCTGSD